MKNQENNIENCYATLELPVGATLHEIKTAHKDLIKVWHPDRFERGSTLQLKAQRKLIEINTAHECLIEYFESLSCKNSEVGNNLDETLSETIEVSPEAKPSRLLKWAKSIALFLFILVLLLGGYLIERFTGFGMNATQENGVFPRRPNAIVDLIGTLVSWLMTSIVSLILSVALIILGAAPFVCFGYGAVLGIERYRKTQILNEQYRELGHAALKIVIICYVITPASVVFLCFVVYWIVIFYLQYLEDPRQN